MAFTGRHVIAWQWCDREKHASWEALLQQLPAPAVAVVDGHKGLESTLREHWPETKIQRCPFHIRQNIRTHLTMRPKLDAGKELLALAKALTHVADLDQAAAWSGAFAFWEARWEGFLKHRAYARNTGHGPRTPARPKHGDTPTWACAGPAEPWPVSSRQNTSSPGSPTPPTARRSHGRPARWREESTQASKSCSGTTAASANTTPPAPLTGTSTRTPNHPRTPGTS